MKNGVICIVGLTDEEEGEEMLLFSEDKHR